MPLAPLPKTVAIKKMPPWVSSTCPRGGSTRVERHWIKSTEINHEGPIRQMCPVPRHNHSITWHHRNPQLVGRRDKDGWKVGRVSSSRRRRRILGRARIKNLGEETRVTVHLWDLGQHIGKGQQRKNFGSGATPVPRLVLGSSYLRPGWKGRIWGQRRSLEVITWFLGLGCGNRDLFPNSLCTAPTRSDSASGMGFSLLK